MLYALINSTGIHRLEVEQKLELANLQNLVGIQGSEGIKFLVKEAECYWLIDAIAIKRCSQQV